MQKASNLFKARRDALERKDRSTWGSKRSKLNFLQTTFKSTLLHYILLFRFTWVFLVGSCQRLDKNRYCVDCLTLVVFPPKSLVFYKMFKARRFKPCLPTILPDPTPAAFPQWMIRNFWSYAPELRMNCLIVRKVHWRIVCARNRDCGSMGASYGGPDGMLGTM